MVSQSSLMMELANLPSTIARALSDHLWGTLKDQQGLRLRNEAFRLGIRVRNQQLRDLQSEKQENELRQQLLQADVQRLKTELEIRDTRLRHERRVIQSLKIAVSRCEDELAEKRVMIDEYRRDIEVLGSENIRLKAGKEELGHTSHQLEGRLQHEINLRRACVKAELEAKKERDNVVSLWYCQQIRISELEDAMNTSSKCFQMNQSSYQEAEFRRLDAFTDLVSEVQIIWHNINKDSSRVEREHLNELRNVLEETIKGRHYDSTSGNAKFLIHRIARLEDLILRRQYLETNVLDNMQTEWDYLVAREQLYDELRNAEVSLAKMDALDTQKLKEVIRDWRSLNDRAIKNLDLQETFHSHQSKIPIRAAILGFISQVKRQIDELEHSRLQAWMDYVRGISLDENARKEIMIMRNHRTTRLRVGYMLDGCLYCDDDACEGCSSTIANESDDDLTMFSSLEHNEPGQFKGATEDKGRGFVEAGWRMSGEEEETTNHNQEGCLYCDDDSCQGCNRTDISGTGESDTDPTVFSSVNHNDQGQFSNVEEDSREADVNDEGRDSPAMASIDNQDQVNTGQIQQVLGGVQEINPDYKQEDDDSERGNNRTHERVYDSADETAEDYHESQREVPLGACKKNGGAKNGKKTKKSYPKRGRGRHY